MNFMGFFFLYPYKLIHFNIFVFQSIAVIFTDAQFFHFWTLDASSCWFLSPFDMTTQSHVVPEKKTRKLMFCAYLVCFLPHTWNLPFLQEMVVPSSGKQNLEIKMRALRVHSVTGLIIVTMSSTFYSEVYFVNKLNVVIFQY